MKIRTFLLIAILLMTAMPVSADPNTNFQVSCDHGTISIYFQAETTLWQSACYGWGDEGDTVLFRAGEEIPFREYNSSIRNARVSKEAIARHFTETEAEQLQGTGYYIKRDYSTNRLWVEFSVPVSKDSDFAYVVTLSTTRGPFLISGLVDPFDFEYLPEHDSFHFSLDEMLLSLQSTAFGEFEQAQN